MYKNTFVLKSAMILSIISLYGCNNEDESNKVHSNIEPEPIVTNTQPVQKEESSTSMVVIDKDKGKTAVHDQQVIHDYMHDYLDYMLEMEESVKTNRDFIQQSVVFIIGNPNFTEDEELIVLLDKMVVETDRVLSLVVDSAYPEDFEDYHVSLGISMYEISKAAKALQEVVTTGNYDEYMPMGLLHNQNSYDNLMKAVEEREAIVKELGL